MYIMGKTKICRKYVLLVEFFILLIIFFFLFFPQEITSLKEEKCLQDAHILEVVFLDDKIISILNLWSVRFFKVV